MVTRRQTALVLLPFVLVLTALAFLSASQGTDKPTKVSVGEELYNGRGVFVGHVLKVTVERDRITIMVVDEVRR